MPLELPVKPIPVEAEVAAEEPGTVVELVACGVLKWGPMLHVVGVCPVVDVAEPPPVGGTSTGPVVLASPPAWGTSCFFPGLSELLDELILQKQHS
jgi:hypothetical protein